MFLFSSQATESDIYGGAFFPKQQLKVVNYFPKKALPWTFDWVLNTVLGNTVKESSHIKDNSPVLLNFLCLYSYDKSVLKIMAIITGFLTA